MKRARGIARPARPAPRGAAGTTDRSVGPPRSARPSSAGPAREPDRDDALSRRDFLRLGAAAGAGLVIGVHLPGLALAAEEDALAAFEPNVWLRIDPAGRVSVVCARSEMGQGVFTSMPMLIAEELEVELSAVRVRQALAEDKYGDMSTGGSWSVRGQWEPLRKAGAQAREMLITAAAQQWGVEAATCRAEKGSVIHAATGRSLGYGELVQAASKLPVPPDPPLKARRDHRLLGTRAPRLDIPEKVDGRARFGLDTRLAGLKIAVVARPPVFGGSVLSFDPTAAKAVTGVNEVVSCSRGIAVVADTLWAARAGRDALKIEWDEGPNANLSSAAIREKFVEMAKERGAFARMEGDGAAALARAAQKIEAVYEVPFLAHAPMEPVNCAASVTADRCEVWVPTQVPSGGRAAAARASGLPPEKVVLHTTFLGGGFGRRLETDHIEEAVEIAKAVRMSVKVVWSREEDLRHDFYRPATYNVFAGGLDASGAPLVWTHHIVGPSILQRIAPQAIKDGIDGTSVEGAYNLPYAIPNIEVHYSLCETGVPVGFWRSVGSSQNAFVTECFLDEIAAAARRDPLLVRRELLKGKPRMRAVLDLAASKALWGRKLPAGRGRGIAIHASFGSIVAHVAEVSVSKQGAVRVHRVVCAVDCGQTVNPDTIESQMEGGIAFGLTAALKGAITFERGRAVQSNFNDYELLRMSEMPAVEVHIVPSEEKPGGIGEPGVPPIAPAVANAVFAATGKRVRALPITRERLRET